MKLWLISQKINDDYDTYDCAVVAAPDMWTAKTMHPSNGRTWKNGDDWDEYGSSWTNPNNVNTEFLGDAAYNIKQGVICASYHAG